MTAVAVRTEGWKLIRDLSHKRDLLFDLTADPDETTNVVSSHPEKFAEMLQHLGARWHQISQHGTDVPERTLDKAEMKRLKSLGYLD